jgi:hypothetical protein
MPMLRLSLLARVCGGNNPHHLLGIGDRLKAVQIPVVDSVLGERSLAQPVE